MECEICGKNKPLRYVDVAGAKLNVCSDCGSYNPKERPKFNRTFNNNRKPNFVNKNKPVVNKPKQDFTELILAEDYGKRLAQARQKEGIRLEELARELFMPASFLNKVENQKLKPDNGTILKLQKRLNIKLMEKPPEVEEKKE